MLDPDARRALGWAMPVRSAGLIAALAAGLMLGACAQVGGEGEAGLLSSLAPEASEDTPPSDPQQAVGFWSKKYTKNPRDLDAALGYASSLKALDKKREALAVLQEASVTHGTDRRLASDYGRLALELDQVSVAKKVLEVADDPANPDWRVIMARGTALAKEGSYRDAIPFYERARALNPNHASILNNLALAYTMSGEADRGEALLRQASSDGDNAKVRQNLALVLGLQGKYDEATKVGSQDLGPADAAANTALLRKIVKLDPKSGGPSPSAWEPAVATATAVPAAAPASVSQLEPATAPDTHAASADKPSSRSAPASTPRAALRLRSTAVEAESAASARSSTASLFSAE